jgi:hypothetical protein
MSDKCKQREFVHVLSWGVVDICTKVTVSSNVNLPD